MALSSSKPDFGMEKYFLTSKTDYPWLLYIIAGIWLLFAIPAALVHQRLKKAFPFFDNSFFLTLSIVCLCSLRFLYYVCMGSFGFRCEHWEELFYGLLWDWGLYSIALTYILHLLLW